MLAADSFECSFILANSDSVELAGCGEDALADAETIRGHAPDLALMMLRTLSAESPIFLATVAAEAAVALLVSAG